MKDRRNRKQAGGHCRRHDVMLLAQWFVELAPAETHTWLWGCFCMVLALKWSSCFLSCFYTFRQLKDKGRQIQRSDVIMRSHSWNPFIKVYNIKKWGYVWDVFFFHPSSLFCVFASNWCLNGHLSVNLKSVLCAKLNVIQCLQRFETICRVRDSKFTITLFIALGWCFTSNSSTVPSDLTKPEACFPWVVGLF